NYKVNGKWQSISSDEMIQRAKRIALGLMSLGLKPKDKVAIIAANSPDWTLTDAGCQFAGIIDVPIYTTLAVDSVNFILNDSGARVLFIDAADQYHRIKEAISDCRSLEHLVFYSDFEGRPENSLLLSELEEKSADFSSGAGLDQITASIKSSDIATLIYTSGTTGNPKGVMLSHCNIISNVIDAGEKYDFAARDIPLSVLPLSHVFERSAMYLYIFNGMEVYYAESIEKVPENLSEVRPTIFVGVPRIFEKVYARAKLKASQSSSLRESIFDWAISTAKKVALAREKNLPVSKKLALAHKIADRLVYRKLRDFFGGRLRLCVTGGAALPDDIYLIFNGAGIPIMQGYGLTETSPVISSNNPKECRLGTVGRPIRNFRVRIAADGEIEATGPGVMLGYYNNPSATKEAFTEDGWFRTGDIGELDNDGFLKITDRKKELFKTSGGKYIAPSPIEQLLRSSRFISQAALIGNGRKFAIALIVPNFDMLDSYARHKGFEAMSHSDYCKDERIRNLISREVEKINQRLSRFETVKKFALLDREFSVDGGELTPTLKFRRKIIEEKYGDLINELYKQAEEEFSAAGKP
ncbi:MAG TPA: long-chain fatty acid--CoA ligase, partial [Pyrinomonadaceae bacterium]|nr:long-chain fatty acid--CoA ligase [Pyrinomonadaceae bacterium]